MTGRPAVRVAIVTLDGFNEIDSFVPFNILNRVAGMQAQLCGPAPTVRSANGVAVGVEPLAIAAQADAVLIGSGRLTREHVANARLMASLQPDPRRQLVGSQCSGALILAKLGLLAAQPACTDRSTRPHLEAAGIAVREAAFHAQGNVATAGGCLASHYLAAWVAWQLRGREAAAAALAYVVPVGEEDGYIRRALAAVEPFVAAAARSAA